MKVAALYDIHGNVPALEAVLRDVRGARVDEIVVGGDVVPGPMAREALALLDGLEIPVAPIVGNSEAAVLALMRGEDPGPMPPMAREVVAWTARELDPSHEQRFAGWPRLRRLWIPGLGAVVFCHGTPRHENEVFTRRTPEERLIPVFENLGADVVVCGHTHMQFDRRIGVVRVVNAGSVGMPFGGSGAHWLLLGPDIQFRNTPYDLEKAAARIRGTAYPRADEFASCHVLNPPSEASMLEALGRTELSYDPSAPRGRTDRSASPGVGTSPSLDTVPARRIVHETRTTILPRARRVPR